MNCTDTVWCYFVKSSTNNAINKYFWFYWIIQLVEQTELLFYLSIKRMTACLNKEESKGLSFVASFFQILLVRILLVKILLVHIIFVFLLLDIGVIKYFCQTRSQILFYEPMYLDRRIIFLILNLKSGVYLINNWWCQFHPFPRHLDFFKMTQITMCTLFLSNGAVIYKNYIATPW